MKFLKKLIKGLLIVLAFFIAAFYMVKYLQPSIGKAPDQSEMEKSSFYKDGKFQNVVPTASADLKQTPQILKNYWNRKAESQPNDEYVFTEQGKDKVTNDSSGNLYVNWLGHAAILMQKNGKYILADPMLSKRASPFSFLGPKRYSPSPIATEDLPELEAIIISHDHYDHLDYETIIKLKDRTKYFYVPLGVAASLISWGVEPSKIRECTWYDSHLQNDEIRITATPARHFSGRLFSQNNTFWASWVIEWGNDKVYFGGDTGIFDRFAEIDKQFGPFDIAFMPIGAYNEAWHDIHMNPEEAVDAFLQMRADKLYPIHWGTFDLALHSWYAPIETLVKLSDEQDLPLISTPQGLWFSVEESEFDLKWWRKIFDGIEHEMIESLEIIYQDQEIVAVNKPHGLLVHRSKLANDADEFALQILRDQLSMKVFPAHRIDRKTSGILLFALNPDMERELNSLFAGQLIKKEYLAIVRGFIPEQGTVDYPLKKENGKLQEAVTHYRLLQQTEIDVPLGKHETSRYSLINVVPETGRMHQIRKHLAHINYPIIGDRPHGCNKQNKLFKEKWVMDKMMLHANKMSFIHPSSKKTLNIEAGLSDDFQRTLEFLSFSSVSDREAK